MSAFGNGHIMLTSSNKKLSDFNSQGRPGVGGSQGYWTEDVAGFPDPVEGAEGGGEQQREEPARGAGEKGGGEAALGRDEPERVDWYEEGYTSDSEGQSGEDCAEAPMPQKAQKDKILSTLTSRDREAEEQRHPVESEQSKIILAGDESLGVIEYTGEHRLGSIISEPTIEMKNSAMANAQRLIKQANSKAFLESIKKKAFSSKLEQEERIKLVTTYEEPRGSQGAPESPRKPKNALYEPEEVDVPLHEKIEVIRCELEQKQIITENIANNTNSSACLREEIRKVSDSLQNFESFSQKTGTLGAPRLSINDFLLDERGEDGRVGAELEDLIDLSVQNQMDRESRRSATRGTRDSLSLAKADEADDLPVNEKLKLLIQKDLETGAECDPNLIQSSTGGHPKHHVKTEPPVKSPVAKRSRRMLGQIKGRTEEARPPRGDGRVSKSPGGHSRLTRRTSFKLDVEPHFSRTLATDPSRAKREKWGVRAKKGTSRVIQSMKNLDEVGRAPRDSQVRLTFQDLLRAKHSEKKTKPTRKRAIVSRSLQFGELGEQMQSSMRGKWRRRDPRHTRSFARSSKNVKLDFSKKTGTKSTLTEAKKPEPGQQPRRPQKARESVAAPGDEAKILKGANFTRKKADSEVFDRLAQPRQSLVALKGSRRSSHVDEKAEETETLSQDDVILSSMQGTGGEKSGLVFDSSLINLQHLTGKSRESRGGEQKIGAQDGPTQGETLSEREDQAGGARTDGEPREAEDKTQAQAEGPRQSEAEEETREAAEESPKQPEPRMKNEGKRRGKRPRRTTQRKALTPHNSLKKEFRHLKPRRRNRFEISEQDYVRFLKRSDKKGQEPKPLQKPKIRKQFKNFFDDGQVDMSNPKFQLNFKKGAQTPEFIGQPQAGEEKPASESPPGARGRSREEQTAESRRLGQTPKNIFKDTRDATGGTEGEGPCMDYQFSDQYSRYKRSRPGESDTGTQTASDLASGADTTVQSSSSKLPTCQDSIASLYDLHPVDDSLCFRKRNAKSPGDFLKIASQFKSETKGNFRKRPQDPGSYKRSYVDRLKKLSSKYKSERVGVLFKNQSQAGLHGRRTFDRGFPANIYEHHSQHSGLQRKFPSPSHKSTMESSHWPRRAPKRRSTNKRGPYQAQSVRSRFKSRDSEYSGFGSGGREGDCRRPIININLGNQPVENLKIVSVPNDKGARKDAMTIQVSYTPSGSQATSRLDNLLSLESSRAEDPRRRFGRKRSPDNIVKSILLNRKKRGRKQFVIDGQGEHKTYGKMRRMRSGGLSGFQGVRYAPSAGPGRGEEEQVGPAREKGSKGEVAGPSGVKEPAKMVDSDCLDHFRIEQMVQNEDQEILKVMSNQEEIYKITFADSQKSADMQHLLRMASSPQSRSGFQSKSSQNEINLYSRAEQYPRTPQFRGTRSPRRETGLRTMSSQKREFRYVHEDGEFGREAASDSSEEEGELRGLVRNQWKTRFDRFKMETAENVGQLGDSEPGATFEADVSEEEFSEAKMRRSDERRFRENARDERVEQFASFENSFEDSD